MKISSLCALICAGALASTAVLAGDKMDKMNDLEIAHAAYTADNIDIRYAHLALAISDNASIRQFAETMIRDHTAINAQALALLNKLNVAPQDNDFSRSLLAGAAKKQTELRRLTGRKFDCAYATNELGYHQVVNKTVEDDFIPNVTVPELEELLTDALVIFKVHEGHAGRMVNQLKCSS